MAFWRLLSPDALGRVLQALAISQVAGMLVTLLSGTVLTLMPTVTSVLRTLWTLLLTRVLVQLLQATLPVVTTLISAVLPVVTPLVSAVLLPRGAIVGRLFTAILLVVPMILPVLLPWIWASFRH